jgi:mitochondrial division protein 1
VTGASDKTLRQWDLATGQCVMTMDILWAISHPPSTVPAGHLPGFSVAGTFAVPTPPYADGSWELYQDFIGAVQSWEYALVSGSGDGVVRMWDMRTGQAHRTLLGHTGPVTCLQFDEIHAVSGSLDKSVRVRSLFISAHSFLFSDHILKKMHRSGTCVREGSLRRSNTNTV